MSILAATYEHRWRPGIGDPTIYGWLTVLWYVLAAGLAFWAMQRAEHRGQVRYWAVVGAVLVAMAINKQMDLQSWLTYAARDFAKEVGWYEQKVQLQRWFVGGVTTIVLVALVGMAWLTRRLGWMCHVSTLGLLFLGYFIVMRASSFHNVHWVIYRAVPGVNMNVVFEWSGIAITATGAALAVRAYTVPNTAMNKTDGTKRS